MKLSRELWVHDDEARETYTNDLLRAAHLLADSKNETARAIGLCRYAITPGLVDWLAGELRSRIVDPPPKRLLTAMNVATVAVMADFAKKTLMRRRIVQFAELSAREKAAYIAEELAS